MSQTAVHVGIGHWFYARLVGSRIHYCDIRSKKPLPLDIKLHQTKAYILHYVCGLFVGVCMYVHVCM